MELNVRNEVTVTFLNTCNEHRDIRVVGVCYRLISVNLFYSRPNWPICVVANCLDSRCDPQSLFTYIQPFVWSWTYVPVLPRWGQRRTFHCSWIVQPFVERFLGISCQIALFQNVTVLFVHRECFVRQFRCSDEFAQHKPNGCVCVCVCGCVCTCVFLFQ